MFGADSSQKDMIDAPFGSSQGDQVVGKGSVAGNNNGVGKGPSVVNGQNQAGTNLQNGSKRGRDGKFESIKEEFEMTGAAGIRETVFGAENNGTSLGGVGTGS